MTPTLRTAMLYSCLALVAAGCGGKCASVEGTVRLDGQPVQDGFIAFVPIEATEGPTGRVSIVDGEYVLDPSHLVKPGAYRVEIHAQQKTGKKILARSPAPSGTMVDEEIEAIPARYNRASTIRAELKAGNNSFDYDLKSK